MTTQSTLKIIVEGPTDAEIVRAILGEDLAKKARFFASQGHTSLATLARNVLIHEGGPVLLVMDSETLDPQLITERESIARVALSGALTSGAQIPTTTIPLPLPFQVFAFVPTIKAVFFEAPQALARILGKAPPPEKVKEGRLVPEQTLSDLLANAKGASRLSGSSQEWRSAGTTRHRLWTTSEGTEGDGRILAGFFHSGLADRG
jgi:hypothetical protein